MLPSSRAIVVRVYSPAAPFTSRFPVIRRWMTSTDSRPSLRRRSSRYLPCRSSRSMRWPARRASVSRASPTQVRGQRNETDMIVRPASAGVSVRRTVSTSGSSACALHQRGQDLADLAVQHTSAMTSSGVGSRLTIISRAPARLAMRGREAAGSTTSEEPTASRRSQDSAAAHARTMTSWGMAWPKDTVAGLSSPPHGLQRGANSPPRDAPARLVGRYPVAAGQADRLGRGAVQLKDQLGRQSRPLVQALDVLRDHRRQLALLVQSDERVVPGVRARVAHGGPAFDLLPPVLDASRLARQEFLEVDGPVARPDPVRAAEVRHARLGRDAGAGEADHT